MASERPPFDNVALLADNDRMYHRIGWVGNDRRAAAADHRNSHDRPRRRRQWTIRDRGAPVASYPDAAVRISILWKARPALVASDPPPLTRADRGIIHTDLIRRGIADDHDEPDLDDNDWLRRVHDTYYPDLQPRR